MPDFKINITADASQAIAEGKKVAPALPGGAPGSPQALDTKKLEVEANKEVEASVIKVGEADIKAAEASAEADAKAFASKKDLKGAVKGLKEEFPELAHIAKMALNPIVLVVAAIGAGFAIFKYRVEEATKAMAGFELPDLSEAKVGQITAAAEAMKAYAEALRSTLAAHNSVNAAADRYLVKIKAETEEKKKLLAADKGLELAKLEQAKGTMSVADYEAAKLGIEGRYAKAGIAADKSGKEHELQEKARRAANLLIDAQAKQTAANAIKVASADKDAQNEGDLKAQADMAKKDAEDRKKERGNVAERQAGGMFWGLKHPVEFFRQYARYGTDMDSGIEIEQRGIDSDEQIVARYKDFMRRKGARNDARATKQRLSSEAGTEAGEAYNLASELPGDLAASQRENQTNASVAQREAMARGYAAAGAMNAELLRASQELQKLIAAGYAPTKAMTDSITQLQRQVQTIEGQLRANRPPGL